MRVLVSVGTHEQPFDRLLRAVEGAIAQFSLHEWVVQHGVSRLLEAGQSGVRTRAFFSGPEMDEEFQAADLVVSQASPGIVFGALRHGAWPVVLGRRKSSGEHVDDHQVSFARFLADRGLATELTHSDDLVSALAILCKEPAEVRAERVQAAAQHINAREKQFRDDVWAEILGVTVR